MGEWFERWGGQTQPECQQVVQEEVVLQRGCLVEVQMPQGVHRIALGFRQGRGQTKLEGICECEGFCR